MENQLDPNSNINGIMTYQKSQALTEKQIDKAIEQNGQANEYLHKERMQELEKYKIMSFDYKVYLICLLVFLSLILVVVAIVDKSLLSTAVTGIFGLLGGLGIGYGVGKADKEKEK